MMIRDYTFVALAALMALSACSDTDGSEPVPIFPDAEAPTTFTRAYSMTESFDGLVRVYAKEKGDETWLYEVHQDGRKWSEPVRMDLPARKTLTGPSFSRADGMLYYSSDAELPDGAERKDLNIWRVALKADGWGTPEPLPGDINTGANETMAVIASDGSMVFTSNHRRTGGGGYDMAEARMDGEGNWNMTRPLDELNDLRTDDHLALTSDGRTLFFYSHRSPKLGVVDIWVSHKQDDGTWSVPQNPGEPLNSTGIDYGAGLSHDDRTLFFSREGALYEMPVSTLQLAPH